MIWVFVTIAVLAIAWSLAFWIKHFYKKTGWGLVVLALLLTAFFVTGTVLCWNPPETPEQESDYGLLLGCGLENGQARPEMVARCMTALQWMEANPKSTVIAAGGDPGEQGVTEAAVMAAWLRNHGADPEYILLEDQSNDTRENVLNSKALAEEAGLETDHITIITSDYHQNRAAFLAEQAGQTPACMSAPTPLLVHFVSAVREVYAMVSEVLGL